MVPQHLLHLILNTILYQKLNNTNYKSEVKLKTFILINSKTLGVGVNDKLAWQVAWIQWKIPLETRPNSVNSALFVFDY